MQGHVESYFIKIISLYLSIFHSISLSLFFPVFLFYNLYHTLQLIHFFSPSLSLSIFHYISLSLSFSLSFSLSSFFLFVSLCGSFPFPFHPLILTWFYQSRQLWIQNMKLVRTVTKCSISFIHFRLFSRLRNRKGLDTQSLPS